MKTHLQSSLKVTRLVITETPGLKLTLIVITETHPKSDH